MRAKIGFTVAAVVMAATTASPFTEVTVEQVKEIIETGQDVVLLDVRERWEYETGHIPGAINLPWNSQVLQAEYASLPKDRPVIVVCRSGNRSRLASAFLDERGFGDVRNMLGGMVSWPYKVETGLEPTTWGSVKGFFREPSSGVRGLPGRPAEQHAAPYLD